MRTNSNNDRKLSICHCYIASPSYTLLYVSKTLRQHKHKPKTCNIPDQHKGQIMKKYKVHLKNARQALNAGNVDAYKRGISALIRSAPSMKSRKYLIDELVNDGFTVNPVRGSGLLPVTAKTITKI